MMNRYKIYRIVEYIKLFEFEFDTYEVTENLNTVLAHYDVVDIDLTDEEQKLLTEELFELAEQFEFRESAHLALQEDPLIAQIPGRRFCLRMEEIERKLVRTQSHTSVTGLLHKLALA